MEHFVLALAILAFGLLLFTVGTRPSHSDPTGNDIFPQTFPESNVHNPSNGSSHQKKSG